MKKYIIGIVVIILIVVGFFVFGGDSSRTEVDSNTLSALDRAEGNIVGRWQSIDDENSEIVFGEDKSFGSLYSGDVMDGGTWEFYTEGENLNDVFLRTDIEGEVYEYIILEIGSDKLVMSYLSRGNTLSYTKVLE